MDRTRVILQLHKLMKRNERRMEKQLKCIPNLHKIFGPVKPIVLLKIKGAVSGKPNNGTGDTRTG